MNRAPCLADEADEASSDDFPNSSTAQSQTAIEVPKALQDESIAKDLLFRVEAYTQDVDPVQEGSNRYFKALATIAKTCIPMRAQLFKLDAIPILIEALTFRPLDKNLAATLLVIAAETYAYFDSIMQLDGGPMLLVRLFSSGLEFQKDTVRCFAHLRQNGEFQDDLRRCGAVEAVIASLRAYTSLTCTVDVLASLAHDAENMQAIIEQGAIEFLLSHARMHYEDSDDDLLPAEDLGDNLPAEDANDDVLPGEDIEEEFSGDPFTLGLLATIFSPMSRHPQYESTLIELRAIPLMRTWPTC